MIEKLAKEVAALEQKIPSPIRDNQSAEARALVLSIGLLRESVRAGRPFDSELAALNVLVQTNQQNRAYHSLFCKGDGHHWNVLTLLKHR